jgi:hypothetical protein
VSFFECKPTFRRNISSPSSGSKNKLSKKAGGNQNDEVEGALTTHRRDANRNNSIQFYSIFIYVLTQQPEGKIPLEGPNCAWQDNSKIDLKRLSNFSL